MGRISNQIRQLDVAGWGITALCCGALAVLGANLAGFIPPNLLAGLHATHIQGGSFNQMRAQLAEISAQTGKIDREYASLMTRFNLLADNTGEAGRRLAAVEDSLPLLIEALPPESDIDRSLLTASISGGDGEVIAAEGGDVHISRSDLFAPEPQSQTGGEASPAFEQPMPPALPGSTPHETSETTPDQASGHGIAIGQSQPRDALAATWRDTIDKVGVLLLGLEPRAGGGDDANLVAGPLPDMAAAQALCVRIERAGIACSPAPYEGTPLLLE